MKKQLTADSPELVSFLKTWNESYKIRRAEIIYGRRAYAAQRFYVWELQHFLRGNDYKKEEELRTLEAIDEKKQVFLGTSKDELANIRWCQVNDKLVGIQSDKASKDYYLFSIKELKKHLVIPEPFIVESREVLKEISLFKKPFLRKPRKVNLQDIADSVTFTEITQPTITTNIFNREKNRFDAWLREYWTIATPISDDDKKRKAIINLPDVINCSPDAVSTIGFLGNPLLWYQFKDAVVSMGRKNSGAIHVIPNEEYDMPRFSELEEQKERERYLNSYTPKIKSVLGMED
jgi:hypothetical protein